MNSPESEKNALKIVITAIVISFEIYFFGKAVDEAFYHAIH